MGGEHRRGNSRNLSGFGRRFLSYPRPIIVHEGTYWTVSSPSDNPDQGSAPDLVARAYNTLHNLAAHYLNSERANHTLAKCGDKKTGKYDGRGDEVVYLNNMPAIRNLVSAIMAARLGLDDLKRANPQDLDAAIVQVLEPVERAWNTIDEMTPVGEG